VELLRLEFFRASRSLTRQWLSGLLAVLTLGFSVAGVTAVYSLFDQAMVKSLPVSEPEHLRFLDLHSSDLRFGLSLPDLADVRASGAFREAAVYGAVDQKIESFESLRGAMASVTYFRTMGLPLLQGRFAIEDAEQGLVIGHGLWQRMGKPSLDGSSLVVGGRSFPVLGIGPKAFRGLPGEDFDFWLSPGCAQALETTPGPPLIQRLQMTGWRTLVRLKGRAGLEQSLALVDRLVEQWAQRDPNGHGLRDFSLPGAPKPDRLRPRFQPLDEGREKHLLMSLPMPAIFGCATATLLILGVLCVANLHLARFMTEGHDHAVRQALGAGLRHLFVQIQAEAMILGIHAAILGFVGGWVEGSILANLNGLCQNLRPEPNLRVFGFALVVAMVGSFAALLIPAFRFARGNAFHALKAQGHGSKIRFQNGLLVGQVALSLLLLSGMGLACASLWKASRQDMGFRPEGLITCSFSVEGLPPLAGMACGNRIMERVRALPHVRGASLWGGELMMSADARPPLKAGEYYSHAVGADFFKTLGVSIRHGRDFGDLDGPEGHRVAIINEAQARTVFPGQDPIGKSILDLTIVGVVADYKDEHPLKPPHPLLFTSINQPFFSKQKSLFGTRDILVRTDGSLHAVGSAVQDIIHRENPSYVPVLRNISDDISSSQRPIHIAFFLLGITALQALAMVLSGIYGLQNYLVQVRTREIGLRIALGASGEDIMGMILRQGYGSILSGVGIGLLLSVCGAMLVRSQAFGLGLMEQMFLPLGATLPILAITGVACYLPALRATKIQPNIALRE